MKLIRILLLAALLCGALLGGCSSTPTDVYSEDEYKGTTRMVEERSPD
jgi:hypothetical protein